MKWVLVVATVAAAAAGCAHGQRRTEDPRGAPAKLGEYYPLAVGNSWTYRGSFLGHEETKTVTVEKVEDGFHVDSHGGALKFDAEGLRDRSRYLIRLPMKKGASWRSIPSPVSVEHYEIVDDAAQVSTPAGLFAGCLVVRSRNRQNPSVELVAELTYAPGVGIVRIETYLVDKKRGRLPQTKMELLEYRLAGTAAGAKR